MKKNTDHLKETVDLAVKEFGKKVAKQLFPKYFSKVKDIALEDVPELFFYASPESDLNRIIAKWKLQSESHNECDTPDIHSKFKAFLEDTHTDTEYRRDPLDKMRDLCNAAIMSGLLTLGDLAEEIGHDITASDLKDMFEDYLPKEFQDHLERKHLFLAPPLNEISPANKNHPISKSKAVSLPLPPGPRP